MAHNSACYTVTYDFLSFLPTTESLAKQGRRLQETLLQRQSRLYAQDIFIEAEIQAASWRLSVNFVDDGHLQVVLAHGECKKMQLWLSNQGILSATDDIWLVTGPEHEYLVNEPGQPRIGQRVSLYQSTKPCLRITRVWKTRCVALDEFSRLAKALLGSPGAVFWNASAHTWRKFRAFYHSSHQPDWWLWDVSALRL